MLRRRRERRGLERIQEELDQQALLRHDRISREACFASCAPAPAQPPSVEEEFLPKELRAHTREDLAGMLMRHDKPIVIGTGSLSRALMMEKAALSRVVDCSSVRSS